MPLDYKQFCKLSVKLGNEYKELLKPKIKRITTTTTGGGLTTHRQTIGASKDAPLINLQPVEMVVNRKPQRSSPLRTERVVKRDNSMKNRILLSPKQQLDGPKIVQ